MLLLGLAGCAARSRVPAGFDLDAVTRGPIALGGVASLVEYSTAGLGSRGQLAEHMATTFVDQRRDLHFAPQGVVRDRMGEERYAALIARYREGAGIDSLTYVLLVEAMGADARFLGLARIESVTVSYSQKTTDPDYNLSTDNNKVIKSTHRNVWLSFSLFDLEARREVWTDNLTESTSSEVSFNEKLGGGILGTVREIFRSDPDHPPPPSAYRALEKTFSRFAKEIPKRKSKR